MDSADDLVVPLSFPLLLFMCEEDIISREIALGEISKE
jgi:hypothetical protein